VFSELSILQLSNDGPAISDSGVLFARSLAAWQGFFGRLEGPWQFDHLAPLQTLPKVTFPELRALLHLLHSDIKTGTVETHLSTMQAHIVSMDRSSSTCCSVQSKCLYQGMYQFIPHK
jgi:hypothetical protein